MNTRVLHILSQPNTIELQQQEKNHFIEDIPEYAIQTKNVLKSPKILTNQLFKNNDVYISRHNRYADYPTHAHTFLEMNYMLHGSSSQIVNGEKIKLSEGDILLMDIGTEHSIKKLEEEDSLINILFKPKIISIDMLTDICRSNSILFNFLINRTLDTDSKQKFLIFRHKKGNEIAEVIDKIIEEYYLKRDFSKAIIKSYLQVLLVQLVRNYPLNKAYTKNKNKLLIIKALNYITTNYKDIRLDHLAKKLGYNKNYISTLFKSETGRTFSSAVTQQRLIQAHNLITSTNIPINDVAQEVGITNKTFFYTKYKELYHCHPGDDR